MPGTSRSEAAIQVAPGVPASAAANRWVTAPIASAATAVRSARWERGWSRSTSCNAKMSGSRDPHSGGQPIKIDHPVTQPAAVQDVECRQPHGKKVRPSLTHHRQQTGAALRDALKRSAAALKADGVPFALGGGYALWVHGAPEPDHDVDLVVAEAAVEVRGSRSCNRPMCR